LGIFIISEVDVGYNSKLLMASYNSTASLGNQIYDYYPDGRIQRVRRPNDPTFERSYTYDHMSRIQQALTGKAAQGLPEDNEFPDPYKQNFSYDAFSNLTLRTNRFWNHDADGLPASYANNRNLAWTYDEAGNVKTADGSATMTYNTASQMTKWEAGANIEQSYDGDGLPASRIESRIFPAFTRTLYYLRSTVLGGAVIADLNPPTEPQGAGQYRYIYANGGVLAREEFKFGGWVMSWQQSNPVTGDRKDGVLYRAVDPLGGLVGPLSPYIKNPNPTYEEMVGERHLFVEDGNPFGAGMDCGGIREIDGLPADCSQVRRMMQNGLLDVRLDSGVFTGKFTNVPGRGGSFYIPETVLVSDIGGYSSDGAIRLGVGTLTIPGRWVSFNFFNLAGQNDNLPKGKLTFNDLIKLMPSAVTPELATNQDVLKDLYCLWKRGGYGFRDTERSIWITNKGGKYGSIIWPFANTSKSDSWDDPIPRNAVAQAHTHPDRNLTMQKASPQPSTTGGNTGRGDQGTSDKIGLPIYVVTGQSIWKTIPHTKNPVQVAEQDWWKPFEKAKLKCN
jgi:hypothetical protein